MPIKPNQMWFDIETAGVSRPVFGTHFYRSSILEVGYTGPGGEGSLTSRPASRKMSTWSYETVWKPLTQNRGIALTQAMDSERQMLQKFLGVLQSNQAGTELIGWNIGYSARAVGAQEALSAGYDIAGIMTRASMYGMGQEFQEAFGRHQIRDVGQEFALKLSRGMYRQTGRGGIDKLIELGLLDSAAVKGNKFQLADDYLEALLTKNIDILEAYRDLPDSQKGQVTASSDINSVISKINKARQVSGASPLLTSPPDSQLPSVEQNLRRQLYGHYKKVLSAEDMVGTNTRKVAQLLTSDTVKMAGWAQETVQKTFMEFYAGKEVNPLVEAYARQQGVSAAKAQEVLGAKQAHLAKEDVRIAQALTSVVDNMEEIFEGPEGKKFFSIWGRHAQKKKMVNSVIFHGFSGSVLHALRNPEKGQAFGGLFTEGEFLGELEREAKVRYGQNLPDGATSWRAAISGLGRHEVLEQKYSLTSRVEKNLSEFPGVPFDKPPGKGFGSELFAGAVRKIGLRGVGAGILGAAAIAGAVGPLSPVSDPASEFTDSMDPYWQHTLLGIPSISGSDDEYNTISGLRHGRMAGDLRGRFTDFGSGWIPGRGRAEELSDPEFALDPNIESRRRVKAIKDSGQVTKSDLLGFQRSYQYAQDATLSTYLLELAEQAPARQNFGTGWLFGKVAQSVMPEHPAPETLYGVNLDPRVLEFRKNILQDPDAYADYQEEYKAAQREGRDKLGKLHREDMFRENLSMYEGISVHAKNLQTINLKNFVTEVEDADTLILKRKGLMNIFAKPIHVRLSGIDAPEVGAHGHDPMAKWRINQEQPYGREATNVLKGLLEKGSGPRSGLLGLLRGGGEEEDINLLIDPTQSTYGRYVGVLAGDQGRNINLELLEQGAVSALPWGRAEGDILDRSLAEQYEAKAAEGEQGMWRYTRYKAIREMGKVLGTDITYNQYTDISKLAAKPDFAAWAGYLEGMGPTQYRPLGGGERSAIRGVGANLRRAGFSSRKRPVWQRSYSGGPTSRPSPVDPPSQNLKYKLFQPQIPLTAEDDAYVNVEGLRHGGSAAAGRRHLDFGSGWSRYKNSAKKFYFQGKKTYTSTTRPTPPASGTSISSHIKQTSVAARGTEKSHTPSEFLSQGKKIPSRDLDLASKEFVQYSDPGRGKRSPEIPDSTAKNSVKKDTRFEDEVRINRLKSSSRAARNKAKLNHAHRVAVISASKNSQNPGKRSRMGKGVTLV